MKQRASGSFHIKTPYTDLFHIKLRLIPVGQVIRMVRLQVHPGIQELEEVRIPEQVEDPVPGGFVSDLIEFSAELNQGRCLLLAESDQQALRPHCVLSEEGRFGRGSACCISCISCGKGTHRYNA